MFASIRRFYTRPNFLRQSLLEKRILLRPATGGFRGVIAAKKSELVTQSELDLPDRANHGETLGSSKVAVSRPSVESPKNVPVERVRYVRFEDNGVVFVEDGSFLDGEVLIEVALAADIAEDQGGIAVDESALGH